MKLVEVLETMAGSDIEGSFLYKKGEKVLVSDIRYASIKGANVKLLPGEKKKVIEKRPSNHKLEKRG